MPEISYGGAALAGLLSFLSPCILPMVPFYLCYLAGISMGELRGSGQIDRARGRQRGWTWVRLLNDSLAA